jgi:4-hydroxy-3-polyprenylbenzoate decarboxylase
VTLPLVVAITGATGVVYGAEMLKVLNRLGVPVHLILSESAVRNFAIETDYKVDEIEALADVVYKNRDIAAAVATTAWPSAPSRA